MVRFSIDALLVNFPEEMFNDALFFLEEAKKLDKQETNDWLRWRYLRGSIMYSLITLEAYVNIFIVDYTRNILKLPNFANYFANERINLETKFKKNGAFTNWQRN